MKKIIEINGKDYEFVANLGTTDLYQKLTGENLLSQLASYRNIKAGNPDVLAKSQGILDIYKKLAFVMHVQATAPDIKTMFNQMNEADYFGWIMQFDTSDLTPEFINGIVELWSGTRKTHVQPKNP